MNNSSEKQLERIARWLDGQKVELTAEERQAAEAFAVDETAAVALLGVRPPAEVLARARRRMQAEVARPRRLAVWMGGSLAAAAAAMIVLSLAIWYQPQQSNVPAVSGDLAAMSYEELLFAQQGEADQVSDQLAILENEVSCSGGDLQSGILEDQCSSDPLLSTPSIERK